MKNLWKSIKWIFVNVKPFIKYLVIIIVLGVVTSLIDILRALLSKQLIDSATSRNLQMMFELMGIFAMTIILELLMRAVVSIITARFNIQLTNSLQQSFYKKIMGIKWLEFTKYHSGDVLTRMTSDVDAITNIITNTIPTLISLVVLLIGSFIAFLFLEPVLGVILIIVSPITIIVSKYLSSRLKKMYLKFQEIESRYRSFLNESIQNMIIVKTFCLEETNIKAVKNLQKERLDLTIARAKIAAFANSIMISGFWINYFLVFGWGTFKLYNKATTFGSLTAMISLIGNIQGPISGMAMLLPQVIAAIGSAERLQQFENLDAEDTDIKCDKVQEAGIIYENVWFSYKKNKPILKNISVNIKQGETVALVGPSGEGKTTFINLLLALVDAEKGNIYIKHGNKNIPVSVATRKLISYVPQGNTLFSGTIRENLLFGNLSATEEELEMATKSVCAFDFIKSNPAGFNAVLGERGMGLSEGQAQRLAIARALLHKTPILLLDECTSALDANTEIQVLETIKNLKPAPTCIIITHRTTALDICHRVFIIDKGELKEK
ncbi:ABC transporter ATP-binding protein [Clostridium akagii]|uniref:ABC transporter ATP-binding protein n=1 Tax=Clostridium akagii TaxID=91623 RepID=UPI000A060850|nr:ABC transporter ATP-binding protein [Clostridium akagii]